MAPYPLYQTIGTIWLAVVGIHAWVGFHRERHYWKEREKRRTRIESDGDKFRRMAQEQRDLACQARKDGMPDLADMQDNLADQYEQTARIYDRETA